MTDAMPPYIISVVYHLRACATEIIVPVSICHAHNSYRFRACATETCLMHVQIIQHVKIMEDDF